MVMLSGATPTGQNTRPDTLKRCEGVSQTSMPSALTPSRIVNTGVPRPVNVGHGGNRPAFGLPVHGGVERAWVRHRGVHGANQVLPRRQPGEFVSAVELTGGS